LKAKPDIMPVELAVSLYLDFAHGFPQAGVKCASPDNCQYSRTQPKRGTIYREPIYLPLLIYHGPVVKKSVPQLNQLVAFSQFGVARSLPFDAPIFGAYDWSITFEETGEISQTAFGGKATGVNATGLLSTSADAASSIAAERLQAIKAVDEDTLRLQRENAELSARIDNINKKRELLELMDGEDEPE
jgi:hypothetical protein